MPLIIVTGLPCSGKTYRAQQILAYFESRLSKADSANLAHVPRGAAVQHLASSHASLDPSALLPHEIPPSVPPINPRDLIYNSAREEKTARAEEFSAAKRALSKTNVVIADAPNYIKGFRYQLWCEAKAVGTRSVIVHTAASEAECLAWNETRIVAWNWADSLSVVGDGTIAEDSTKYSSQVLTSPQPSSHTAIYGDKPSDELINKGSRSRSSSMGGAVGDDENDELHSRRDTVTLKSLYISDPKGVEYANVGGAPDDPEALPSSTAPQSIKSQPSESTISSSPPHAKAGLPYAPATLKSLSMRYEPPSPFTRWDTPLFTIPSSDAHPPYQAIWDALFPQPSRPPKRVVSQLKPGDVVETKVEEVHRHAATVLPKATGAEALQTLESATADVVKILLITARDRGVADGAGGDLTFSVTNPKGGSDIQVTVEIPLNTVLSQPVLQRLRRKYTQVQRGGIAHGQGYVNGRPDIVKDFCRFLETEWNTE